MQLCHLQEIMYSLPPKQEKTEVISRGIELQVQENVYPPSSQSV